VHQPAILAFQVAPAATAGVLLAEEIRCADGAGAPIAVREIAGELGARIHLVAASAGGLTLDYTARVQGRVPGPSIEDADAPTLDTIVALRQSRYCPSDALAGFAANEFPESNERTVDERATRVATWVFERLAYSLGSSGPLDSALETLHAGAGVCRDFAHLTITLCRALGVPARLASVYAPGLSPMDFHAVVEVRAPDRWHVLDPARLAPRTTLVRIATGRDAADTAFATTLRGDVELVTSRVFASSDGDLPDDDHTGPVALA